MSGRPIPKRVQIGGNWYEASEGSAGFNLSASALISTLTYTARTPYAHLSNLFFVYDADGGKVGEFDVENGTCSGGVTDFEVSGSTGNERGGSGPSVSGGGGDGDGCSGIFGVIAAFIVFAIFRSKGGMLGAVIGFIVVLAVAIVKNDGSLLPSTVLGAFLGCLIGAVIDKAVRRS